MRPHAAENPAATFEDELVDVYSHIRPTEAIYILSPLIESGVATYLHDISLGHCRLVRSDTLLSSPLDHYLNHLTNFLNTIPPRFDKAKIASNLPPPNTHRPVNIARTVLYLHIPTPKLAAVSGITTRKFSEKESGENYS
ncbi:hypothetical protein Trydic_g3539 [Trypoxylus dichotomus]